MNILNEIAARTTARIDERKKVLPFDEVVNAAKNLGSNRGLKFEEALRGGDISFICEIKKASPSKGVIAADFPYLDIAKDYTAAGAAAISVLTEPFYFQGNDSFLRGITDTVPTPLLRKDFTIDPYMIYEAKVLGASAVLLICALLDGETLAEYIDIAHGIGLSALVEAHDKDEVKAAVDAGARVIGVNNRDLKTFEVDINLSARLRQLVPDDIIFVSESGIETPDDINKLREIRADAALIGEALMRSPDKTEALKRLKGGLV
jgi:indole-3-glycerol phosphate synthase